MRKASQEGQPDLPGSPGRLGRLVAWSRCGEMGGRDLARGRDLWHAHATHRIITEVQPRIFGKGRFNREYGRVPEMVGLTANMGRHHKAICP